MIYENSLYIETVINVSPYELWKLITNKDDLKAWFFDIPDFRPVVGTKFTYRGHGTENKFDYQGRIKTVLPLLRLTYMWSYVGYRGESEVTFKLRSAGISRTIFTVIHAGIESLPKGNPKFERKHFIQGWRLFLIESLKPYAESRGYLSESLI